jgi:glycine/D-amino acid oxidase-like deaminating enzyme
VRACTAGAATAGRLCVVGGGLAGSLLAWRLGQARTDWQLDLVPGERTRTDATSASGGAVRAFETDPEQRRLACDSLVELLGSTTLREWSGYRRVDSVYLRPAPDGLDAALADLDAVLPGSARLVPVAELERSGWAGLPTGTTAVVEREAGYTAPGPWRDAVLGDPAFRRRVRVLAGSVTAIDLTASAPTCTVAGRRHEYDVVVVAAGQWSGSLLGTSGHPAQRYRTKSIQYAIYETGDWQPPIFVDETTGLYGRPTADGGLLLGLPVDLWDVDPDKPVITPIVHDEAARLARLRFPGLDLGPAKRRVGSADCYADRPILSLRRVIDGDHRLFTFTGGAGGSAKTVLAASHRAAIQLVEPSQSTELTSVGRGKGQP